MSRSTIQLGGAIKVLGIILGAIVALVAASAADNAGGLAIVGVLIGVAAGGNVYAIGVLISGQGQLLTATLDTAVNTSPFLTDEQKAQSLRL